MSDAAPAGAPAAPVAPAPAAARLLALWRRLAPLPFGRTLFAFALARTVPYSGTIHARVLALEPGRARVAMRDRRGLRNHLGSVHAVALANLGELAGGLALTAALPAGVRGIVRSLAVEYLHKARGPLVAECRTRIPEVRGELEHEVVAEVHDARGAVVARVRVCWRLGPTP